jgi:hypothetical protein
MEHASAHSDKTRVKTLSARDFANTPLSQRG